MIRITFVKEFSFNIEQLTIKNGYFVSKLSFNQLKQVGPSVVVPKNQSKCMALTRPADNIGENSLPPPFLNLSFQLSSFFLSALFPNGSPWGTFWGLGSPFYVLGPLFLFFRLKNAK